MKVETRDKLVEVQAKIEAKGMTFATIRTHRDLIRHAALSGQKPAFKILDTCRLDNSGVLPQDWPGAQALQASTASGSKIAPNLVAFTPAAGAASRYYAPLVKLIAAVDEIMREDDSPAASTGSSSTTSIDQAALQTALAELRAAQATTWPLPHEIRQLIDAPETAHNLSDQALLQLRTMLHWPKALLPYARDSVSFLQAKQAENAALERLMGEVYVTPAGMTEAFAADLENSKGKQLPKILLEQGTTLSSIRFWRNGDPYLNEAGDVSVVPAGHGALAELFPRISETFPAAEALLIRNIDNVIGSSAEALEATRRFLDAHAFVWQRLKGIRQALTTNKLAEAAEIAQTLLAVTPVASMSALNTIAYEHLQNFKNSSLAVLWQLQWQLFHTPVEAGQDLNDVAQLTKLYNRPLNILGQVPNNGRDIGGTPCFVALGEHKTQSHKTPPLKICLELPHASADDKRDFLARPERATHFNPVFVVAEITKDSHYYSRQNHDFWVLAEKSYRGDNVAYFETVLFELLGNSAFANSLFIEIPRILFNPHKTLEDAAQHTQIKPASK